MQYDDVVNYLEKISEHAWLSDEAKLLYINFALCNSAQTLNLILNNGYCLYSHYENALIKSNKIKPRWTNTPWSDFIHSYSFGYIYNLGEELLSETCDYFVKKTGFLSKKKIKTLGYYLNSPKVSDQTKECTKNLLALIEGIMDELMSLADNPVGSFQESKRFDLVEIRDVLIQRIIVS